MAKEALKPAEKEQGQTEKFVHLHVHTHYSLLDGMGKIPDYLDKAKELGMKSMAITDHGVMYGVIEFYKEAKKRNIKPIIGCECYIAPRSLEQKEGKIDTRPHHIVLLAKNQTGYLNLMQLVTTSHVDGYYYKPRIDKKLLRQHSEGLIALSACLHGEVAELIVGGDYKKAKAAALEYAEIFGKDHFYLELQDHPSIPQQKIANDGLKKIAKETGIGLVVTNDVHYVNQDDAEAQDILLCVQMGKIVADEDRMKMTADNSMRTYEDLSAAFPDVPEAFENTLKIAEMCNLEIELDRTLLPDYKVPEGETENSYFKKLVDEGIKKRYSKITPELTERVEFELSVIERMGFAGYFLIVQDYVNWAKDQGIVVGPGRGSAAGSVVAYALGIVDLEPMQYDLLFERFLNPDRISMPDVDMDFADDRRNEVLGYVTEKYGQDRVAQIITFGTMKAKNAIRDVGRALGMMYAEVDRVAKMVPDTIGIKLKDAIEVSQELKAAYKNEPEVTHLINLAMKLEGVARHASTHACAVVISPTPLVEYSPMQRATKGDIAINTQYEMHAIEDLGLLKMDFLGLSNLTVIKNAMRIIKKVHDVDIDIYKIPIDDKKAYKLLSKGQTTGVFQLESAGMKRYIKELKPTCFEDIIAMVALYRPGPMENIPEFIARKHGQKEISYPHPKMEEALKNTYGITVYQEQVMQISKDLAGFTGGQADTLRKAIGKKISSMLKQMRGEFVQGAKSTNNVPEKLANEIFDGWEAFASYAFNKSHAACYALIAYWTAYLKAHYPSAFMAALMTSDYGNIDRITIEVTECQAMGIEVFGPDVNESFSEFGVVKESGAIRFGMMAIKNVGTGIVDAIVKAREEGGKFTGIEDFCSRVSANEVNKKVMEALIKSGAFDSLEDRSTLLYNVEKILTFTQRVQKGTANGQMGLFGEEKSSPVAFKLLLDEPEAKLTSEEKLGFEKELLGIYFSEHPLDQYEEKLKSLNIRPIADITVADNDKDVRFAGVITGIQKILTRKNDPMAFIRFEDKTGNIELIVFPKTLEMYAPFLQDGKVLYVKGKVNNKDNQLKILVDKVENLKSKEGEKRVVQESFIVFDGDATISVPRAATQSDLTTLKLLLSKNKGETETFVLIPNGGEPKRVKMPFGIEFTDELITEINTLLARRQ